MGLRFATQRQFQGIATVDLKPRLPQTLIEINPGEHLAPVVPMQPGGIHDAVEGTPTPIRKNRGCRAAEDCAAGTS